MSRVRVNISLTDDIKKYMDDEAERCGMNLSAFITMCFLEHKKQNESITAMAGAIEQLSKNKKESE